MVSDYLSIIIPAYVNSILEHQNGPAIIYQVVITFRNFHPILLGFPGDMCIGIS